MWQQLRSRFFSPDLPSNNELQIPKQVWLRNVFKKGKKVSLVQQELGSSASKLRDVELEKRSSFNSVQVAAKCAISICWQLEKRKIFREGATALTMDLTIGPEELLKPES